MCFSNTNRNSLCQWYIFFLLSPFLLALILSKLPFCNQDANLSLEGEGCSQADTEEDYVLRLSVARTTPSLLNKQLPVTVSAKSSSSQDHTSLSYNQDFFPNDLIYLFFTALLLAF